MIPVNGSVPEPVVPVGVPVPVPVTLVPVPVGLTVLALALAVPLPGVVTVVPTDVAQVGLVMVSVSRVTAPLSVTVPVSPSDDAEL